MTQTSFNFLPADITQNRHKGHAASRDAFKRGDKAADKARVLELIKLAGWNGMTAKEIAEAMGKPLNAISGRVSDLKIRDKSIYETGDRRQNASVLRAK